MSADQGRDSTPAYDGPEPCTAAIDVARWAQSLPPGYAWCLGGCNSFSGLFDPPQTWRCDRPQCADDASSPTPP